MFFVQVRYSGGERACTLDVLTSAEYGFVGIVNGGVKIPYLHKLLVIDAQEPPVKEYLYGVD